MSRGMQHNRVTMNRHSVVELASALMILLLAGCASPTPKPPSGSDIPTATLPSATTPVPTSASPRPSPTPDIERSLMEVQQVDVRLLSSPPAEVEVAVSGVLGDACTEFDSVEQIRTPDMVTLTLWARRPTNMLCSEVRRPYERIVRLDGDFPPGRYVLTVNDFETTFTVPGPGEEDPVEGLAFVDEVQAQVTETFPAQVTLIVSGWLPDGCTEIDQIDQSLDGNAVHITITARRPSNVLCTSAIERFEQNIPLDGEFFPGEYVAIVNGLEVDFRVNQN